MAVAERHLLAEYEVQIRDGKVSKSSAQVIKTLREDYDILQAREQVERILIDNVARFERGTYLLNLLQPVRSALLSLIMDKDLKLQKKIQMKMRLKNNRMCLEKCQTGSVIHNFTQYEIPVELSKFLESGLNNVPEIVIENGIVVEEVENEIKIACRNLFKEIIGTFPYSISIKDSLDTVIKNLIVLAPNNQELINSLSAMRENYSSRLPNFIRRLNRDKGLKESCSIEKIQRLIPGNSILSPSDKNLGVCLLPPLWYEKQYKEQIIKGGYELQDMDECSCLKMLQIRISDYKRNLPSDQFKILNKYWPKKSIRNPRIGV